MIATPRVLLVGHDASATGAPLAALAWTRWAARSGAVEVEVRLDRGGPLVPSLAAVAPTHVRWGATRRLLEAVQAAPAPRLARGLRRAGTASVGLARRGGDRTVVACSVAAWRSAAAWAAGDRLVLWLHELDGVADRIVAGAEREALLTSTAHIVAVGERVATMAIERWGVTADRVSVVDSFVDPPSSGSPGKPGPPPAQVVAVGSLVPRKGADAFVALVALLARSRPDLRAAWVGGDLDTPFASLIRSDQRANGLDDQLLLPGLVDDVGPWWPTDGVVVHPAREDPAPLVVVEAAQRGIPVVTWDTGGAADLVRQAGLDHLVVAPGDLAALALQVERLLDDPAARLRAGAALRDAAAARTTEQAAPLLLAAFHGGGR